MSTPPMPEHQDGLSRSVSATDTIYKELRRFVLSAEPHQPLASERNLAQRHNVSVAPVRQALAQLVEEGLIYKAHGKGSFVADTKRSAPVTKRIIVADTWNNPCHAYYVQRLQGFSECAYQLGYDVQLFSCPNDMNKAERCVISEKAKDPTTAALIMPWVKEKHFAELKAIRPDLCIVSATNRLPYPGTASILIDYPAMGYMAAEYLAKRKVKRVAIVADMAFAGAALRSRLKQQDPAPSFLFFQASEGEDLGAIVTQLIKQNIDGIACFDGHVGRKLFDAIHRQAPSLLDHATSISAVSAGEDLFAPQVTRMENDGYRVGKATVATIHAMLTIGAYDQATILVAPTLVESSAGTAPSDESGR